MCQSSFEKVITLSLSLVPCDVVIFLTMYQSTFPGCVCMKKSRVEFSLSWIALVAV